MPSKQSLNDNTKIHNGVLKLGLLLPVIYFEVLAQKVLRIEKYHY